jgi:hypothetical protein
MTAYDCFADDLFLSMTTDKCRFDIIFENKLIIYVLLVHKMDSGCCDTVCSGKKAKMTAYDFFAENP